METGRMKELALVAAVAAFAGLAPAFVLKEARADSPPTIQVSCNDNGTFDPKGPFQITGEKTTLILTCPGSYTAQPAPTETAGDQKVYSATCKPPEVKLRTHCPEATGELEEKNPDKMKLSFPTVPTGLDEFCIKCEPPPEGGTACEVVVRVKSPPTPGEQPDGDGSSGGGAQGPGPGGQAGPTGVQTCVHSAETITVRIPDKGSLAQFACESGFTLYPIESDKVFSKDCKKQETLKDMTRTRTPPATSVSGRQDSTEAASPTYTLKADKKPPKKTLCYLCATAGTSVDRPGTAANYCTIYVESGAGAQFSLTFIVALLLPSVLAELQFT